MEDVFYFDEDQEEAESEQKEAERRHFLEITDYLGWHHPDRWFLDPQ